MRDVRVQIVEDDYLVALQVEAALMAAGFEVVGIATSGEQAIEMASIERPALVVMDVRLAGQRDGIDAAIELFRRHGIRSLFVTAHHQEDTRERAAPAAPLGWLPKPYTMTSLVEAVRRALAELDGRNS